MSEYAETSVRYSPSAADAESGAELLQLEQKNWRTYSGVLSRVGLLRYLRALTSGNATNDEQFVRCDWDGGQLSLTVYAYPLRAGISYQLRATVGALSSMQKKIVRETESVSFTLTESASLSHPALRVLSQRWLTGPYDAAGQITTAPALSIDAVSRRILRASRAVFGVVWLVTECERGEAQVVISADAAAAAVKAGFSEFLVGLPTGGRPVALSLSAPPGAAELAGKKHRCGRSSHISVRGAEHQPPIPEAEDIVLHCDYCTLTCDEEP